jgi:thiol-disulfide isomerase/thioredoxin
LRWLAYALAVSGFVTCLPARANHEISDWKGAKGPALTLSALDGTPWTLAAQKGRVVVINFWATWCEPCKAEMPALAALQAKYAGKDLVILPLSIDSETARNKARAFIGQNAPLKIYRDPDYALPPAFSPPVMGVPASFFIDRQGRVRGQVNGDADWTGAAAKAAIDQLLAE